jgi:ABC-2 type transport system permease protein
MRYQALLYKSLLESWRDWKILLLTLSFAPFFTLILHYYYEGSGETADPAGLSEELLYYIPAMLALALMMLLFTAAGALIREKDRGTLVRLRVSGMRPVEWLGAVATVQVGLGLAAVGLTWLAALAIGAPTGGRLVPFLLLTLVSSLSICALGILVAAWLRTSFDLWTVGCFPFFVLMFFSGGMFPLPSLGLFRLGGRLFELNGLLPTTHTIGGYVRVLYEGAGTGDILFELTAILILTLVYGALGVHLFHRRHLSPER